MNRIFKIIGILSWVFFLIIFSPSSKAQFRKYSNEFLSIGAGARALSMGNAQIASVNDATAGYWNPAGLSEVKDYPMALLMHADYFAGIAKYDYGALALPLSNNKRTLGLSILRFAVDDIPNTLFLVEPDGSINYNNIQSFSSADYAFLFSYAQKIKEDENHSLSFGGSAKIVYRKVGSFANAWGFGLDAGVQYRTGKWQLAAMARDVSTTFNAWSFHFTEKEKQALYLTNNDIPLKSTEMTAPKLILGVARSFSFGKSFSLLSEANIDLSFDGKRNTIISSKALSADPRLGMELAYNNNIFIRVGIGNFQRALADEDTLNQKKVWIYQPSVGAGFRINQVTIDYAFSNLANQQNPLYSHIFSLKMILNKKEKK